MIVEQSRPLTLLEKSILLSRKILDLEASGKLPVG